MKKTTNIIHITISPDNEQMLYYEDSRLLKMLNYFPYIMLVIMLLFITVVYYAVTSTKRPNKTECGLDCQGNGPSARHTHIVTYGMDRAAEEP